MKTMTNREGFWSSGGDTRLPSPTSSPNWAGRATFLDALRDVESGARPEYYMGWSTCRVCGQRNGSSSFFCEGWEWPSGLMHYVRDHGVRPSLAFEEFVRGARADETELAVEGDFDDDVDEEPTHSVRRRQTTRRMR